MKSCSCCCSCFCCRSPLRQLQHILRPLRPAAQPPGRRADRQWGRSPPADLPDQPTDPDHESSHYRRQCRQGQRSPYGCDFLSSSLIFFPFFPPPAFFFFPRRSQPSSTSSSLPTAPTCLPCPCSCPEVEGGSLISSLVCVCTPPPLSWKTEQLCSAPASQL